MGEEARRAITSLTIIHLITTAAHFAHNGLRLAEYPGLPADWTAVAVMSGWLPIAALGILGLWLNRNGRPRAGRYVLTIFAIAGFAGLLHFAVAPLTAHSLLIQLTIFAESASGAILLVWLYRRPSPS